MIQKKKVLVVTVQHMGNTLQCVWSLCWKVWIPLTHHLLANKEKCVEDWLNSGLLKGFNVKCFWKYQGQ